MERFPLQIDGGPELDEVDEVVFSVGRAGIAFLAVLLVGRLVIVPVVVRLVSARNPANLTLPSATERYLSGLVVVLAAAAAVVAGGYGHLLSGSAVVVAALTVALGVAGQEVIGNVVSGAFLVADPDFNVEDWISWPDGEGVIESISYRVTRVRTPNNEIVIVPNTTLATNLVTRPFGRDRFRVSIELGVEYGADFDAVSAALADEARAVDGVLPDPPPRARIADLGDDAAEYRVEFWVREPRRSDVVRIRSAFLRRAVDRLGEMGAGVGSASK